MKKAIIKEVLVFTLVLSLTGASWLCVFAESPETIRMTTDSKASEDVSHAQSEDLASEEACVYIPKDSLEEAKEIDPSIEVVESDTLSGDDIVKVETDQPRKIRKEIPKAKKEGFFTLTDDGYTNDYYNDVHDSPQLYNNGFFTLHEQGIKGKGVEIAVIDSDIPAVQDELSGHIDWANAYNAVKRKKIKKGTKATEGHTSKVVSVLTAKHGNKEGIAGVAPEATILPVKAFNGKKTSFKHVYTALKYLRVKKDKGKLKNLRVINMSLGSIDEKCFDCQNINKYIKEYAYAKEIQREINTLHNKYKITIVASAGNEGDQTNFYLNGKYKGKWDLLGDNVQFPADCKNVVSVASASMYNMLSTFSNCRRSTDLVAIGEDLAVINQKGKCVSTSGTSLSAPIVSGAFALMYGKNPKLSEKKILSALKSTGTSMSRDIFTIERRKKDYSNKKIMNVTLAYNKLFGTNYKIDTQYARNYYLGEIEEMFTSVLFKKSTIMADFLHGGACIYGLKWKDIPEGSFSRIDTGGNTGYIIDVKGKNFKERRHTYISDKIDEPEVEVMTSPGQVTISYRRSINDSIEIKIYKGAKLYKKANVEVKGGHGIVEYKTGKRTVKLPKGSYTIKLRNYEHLYRSSFKKKKYYSDYWGDWKETHKIKIE